QEAMREASEDQAALRFLPGEAAEEAVERDGRMAVPQAARVRLRGPEQLGRNDLDADSHRRTLGEAAGIVKRPMLSRSGMHAPPSARAHRVITPQTKSATAARRSTHSPGIRASSPPNCL